MIAFTNYLNNPKNETGCRVVAGFPGGSPDFPASADRVDKFTGQLREQHGLEIVDSIEELCEKVDGILLGSVDGRPHLEQARIVIKAGKPLFIDKPMAGDLADVIEIFRLARENNVPCWSSSSGRYGEGIVGVRDNPEIGEIVACDVFGSSSWAEHHPDLYLYGIHAVEPLFAVMGRGCETVRRIKTDGVDLAVGVWKGGRIGTFRDLRGGKADFGTIIYGKKSTSTGKSAGYAPLLDQIVKFFQTGQPPVPEEETIEIFAFMSAADESKAQGGAAVSLQSLIDDARRQGNRIPVVLSVGGQIAFPVRDPSWPFEAPFHNWHHIVTGEGGYVAGDLMDQRRLGGKGLFGGGFHSTCSPVVIAGTQLFHKSPRSVVFAFEGQQ